MDCDFEEASGYEGRLRALTHDLRHCLYVIQQGLELLDAFREDAAQFQSTLQLLREEQRQASRLIDEFNALARAGRSG